MLTLQQLLESDSLSTVVAKLNQNFQSLSLSNGGPQGIRGAQGIPGLPGKQGQQGATGPIGATAGGVGIVPFACIDSTGPTAIGPAVDSLPSIGTVGPWPYSSWEWLQYYHVSGGAGYDGNPPQNQELYIDPANGGYWQYLETPDEQGASCDGGYTSGGAYSYTGSGSYPDLGATAGWGGPGWYWYPSTGNGAGGNNLGDVWTNDFTTYLISPTNSGPYIAGPYFNEPTPLTIANARLLSKYGTVWITSGNDGLNETGNFTETSTIGNWGDGSGNLNDGPQPGRNNAGVDRLLFKMSIDGLPYLSNIVARGYSGATAGTFNPAQSLNYPKDQTNDQMINGVTISGYTTYWTSPQYNVNLGDYSPLLFLSHRDPSDAQAYGTYGSLGFYMYTATNQSDGTVPGQPPDPYGTTGEIQNNNVSRTLHVMSSRYSTDPLPLYTNQSLDSSKTKNYGELVFDTRRVIASNQYICSLPADMKLSSDYREAGPPRYDENSTDVENLYPYRTFQGYISAINGKSLTGDPEYGDFWEYGLGGDRNGPLGGYTSGTHDQQSGTAGMQTRRTWYGSSVLNEKSSLWDANQPGANDYVRVAGMMERGRRINNSGFVSQGGDGPDATYFYSELIFYTSQFRVEVDQLVNGVGVTIDQINPDNNEHKSRPSLYVSPFGSIGIGTFAGGATATNDLGPLEPSAKLHVHGKYTDIEDDPNAIYKSITGGTGVFSTLPIESFAVAAFTADGTGSRFTDIQIGALSPFQYERTSPNFNIVNSMNDSSSGANLSIKNAVRSERWNSFDLSTLRLGTSPKRNSTQHIGRTSVAAYAQEFQLSIHPLTTGLVGNLESDLTAISGVGIHNLYPRSRTHLYGKNLYNETEYGQELWTPGRVLAGGSATAITTNYPFYGLTANNSPSNNQVIIDYMGDSYQYPVGIYEYQYYSWGATGNPASTGTMSPNSAVYPNREAPTTANEFPTRHAVPYGGITYTNYAYPSTTGGAILNGSYKHGGRTNAWFGPSSYIGFNLFRDLSGTAGDNRDLTRWLLGTQGTDGLNNGNNGAAALFMGSHGDLGIATIPRGFDGGRGYEQWEQRGLGTRDVLNQIKFVFDSHGNLGIANKPGWDLDAYPSLDRDPASGYLYYVRKVGGNSNIYTPIAVGTAGSSGFTGQGVTYTNNLWNLGYRPGMPTYINQTESENKSGAAQINKLATLPEYIRLEVAAEKAWTREGRSLQKQGYGYPPDTTISIPSASWTNKYVALTVAGLGGSSTATFTLITDSEGRLARAYLDGVTYSAGGALTSDNWINFLTRAVFPHPTEFNTGGPLSSFAPAGFIAPPGAQAAEWWYNSIDSPPPSSSDTIVVSGPGDPRFPYDIDFVFTTDTRGSANVRLNNFVYGEGYGFSSTGPTGQTPQLGFGTTANNSYLYTKNRIRQKRQESPKLILTFLESDASATANSPAVQTQGGSSASSLIARGDAYRKVNTVIASAQNEAPLREYWIPKTDNTGGTFMVFTDHFGKKEKDTGFDSQLTDGANYQKLKLLEVVTMEMLQGYTGNAPGINTFIETIQDVQLGMIPRKDPVFGGNPRGGGVGMGFVKYFNPQYDRSGTTDFFDSGAGGGTAQYGVKIYGGEVANSGGLNGMTGSGLGSTGFGSDGYTGNSIPLFLPNNVTRPTYILWRNLDLYYSVHQDTSSVNDQNWVYPGSTDNNKATAIRFKRINSEYALVDYNITVKVENPDLPTGPGGYDGDTGEKKINFGVPTMTQSLKFLYSIDAGEITGNTQDEWGNSIWLTAWSSFANYLPGTAMVNDPTIREVFVNSFTTGSGYEAAIGMLTPHFTSRNVGLSQTYTGNFIDVGFYRKSEGDSRGYLNATHSILNSRTTPFPGTDNPPTMQGNTIYRSPNGVIHGQFDLAYLNANISANLVAWNYQIGSSFPANVAGYPNPTPAQADEGEQFMSRIRSYYSIWGNLSMSRVRNMMWRLVPFVANTTTTPFSSGPNNTFVLEIVFDVPIMHTYHTLNGEVFNMGARGTNPYKYLTLSGQGIVRYGLTTTNANQ
jgi:hypothetical protein